MPVNEPKYPIIAEVIERRIERGDYALNRLPTGRQLSAELGVSYVTARKAIDQLVTSGHLERGENGRLKLGASNTGRDDRASLEIAMLTPAYDSPAYADWRRGLSRAVRARGGVLRPVTFVHADDPVLTETLDAFDGVFLVPPHKLSDPIRECLARSAGKLVTLFDDLTDLGIPCVDGGPPRATGKLIEHLRDLGHHRIDCIHVSPAGRRSRLRVTAWRESLERYGLEGTLHDEPTPDYADPEVHTRAAFDRVLDQPGFNATALFCTTVSAVQGLYRAAYDRGIVVGRDLSICSFGAAERCALFIPSLTTIVTADPMPWLDRALDRITSGQDHSPDSLFIEPQDLELQPGESTGPPPGPRD